MTSQQIKKLGGLPNTSSDIPAQHLTQNNTKNRKTTHHSLESHHHFHDITQKKTSQQITIIHNRKQENTKNKLRNIINKAHTALDQLQLSMERHHTSSTIGNTKPNKLTTTINENLQDNQQYNPPAIALQCSLNKLQETITSPETGTTPIISFQNKRINFSLDKQRELLTRLEVKMKWKVF